MRQEFFRYSLCQQLAQHFLVNTVQSLIEKWSEEKKRCFMMEIHNVLPFLTVLRIDQFHFQR